MSVLKRWPFGIRRPFGTPVWVWETWVRDPLSSLSVWGSDIELRLLDSDITIAQVKPLCDLLFMWSDMVAGVQQICAEWVCTSTWSYLQQSRPPPQIPLALVYLYGRLPILYLPRASDIYGPVSHPISLCSAALLSTLSVAISLPLSVCSPNILPWLLYSSFPFLSWLVI